MNTERGRPRHGLVCALTPVQSGGRLRVKRYDWQPHVALDPQCRLKKAETAQLSAIPVAAPTLPGSKGLQQTVGLLGDQEDVVCFSANIRLAVLALIHFGFVSENISKFISSAGKRVIKTDGNDAHFGQSV